MSACVLPIAPEFQDPPAAANYAPVFLDTDPPAGEIVSATPTVPTFNLVIQDPNVNDTLQVRWIVDYPPLTDATSVMRTDPVPPSPTGQLPLVPPFKPDCFLHHIGPGARHQIYVVVADREFELPGTPVDVERLPPDAKKNSRSWILNLDCSVPQK